MDGVLGLVEELADLSRMRLLIVSGRTLNRAATTV